MAPEPPIDQEDRVPLLALHVGADGDRQNEISEGAETENPENRELVHESDHLQVSYALTRSKKVHDTAIRGWRPILHYLPDLII